MNFKANRNNLIFSIIIFTQNCILNWQPKSVKFKSFFFCTYLLILVLTINYTKRFKYTVYTNSVLNFNYLFISHLILSIGEEQVLIEEHNFIFWDIQFGMSMCYW